MIPELERKVDVQNHPVGWFCCEKPPKKIIEKG